MSLKDKIEYEVFVKIDQKRRQGHPFLKVQSYKMYGKNSEREVSDFHPTRLFLSYVDLNEMRFKLEEEFLSESRGQISQPPNSFLEVAPLSHLWVVFQPLYISDKSSGNIARLDLNSETPSLELSSDLVMSSKVCSLPLSGVHLVGNMFYAHGVDMGALHQSFEAKKYRVNFLDKDVEENAFVNLQYKEGEKMVGLGMMGRLSN